MFSRFREAGGAGGDSPRWNGKRVDASARADRCDGASIAGWLDAQIHEDRRVIRRGVDRFRDLREVWKEIAVLAAPDALSEHGGMLHPVEKLRREQDVVDLFGRR